MPTSDANILIIGDRFDPHIRKVRSHLKRLGVAHHLADPFETIRLPELFHPESAGLVGYTAVWDRLKPTAVPKSNRDQYIFRERLTAIRSLQLLLDPDCLMNPPLATDAARSKLLQMQIARRAGLDTPRTYLGNDPRSVRSFVASCREKAIAKSLTWYFDGSGRFSFTNRIDLEGLRSDPAIALSPMIYQEYVEKSFEVRITCVDRKLYAAKIHSQQNAKSTVDWRRDQFKVKQEVFALPQELERKIIQVLKGLGLKFGAFDFIVTPTGRFVFLEVNASGNWLWLENLLEFPISQAIAAWLAGDGRTARGGKAIGGPAHPNSRLQRRERRIRRLQQ